MSGIAGVIGKNSYTSIDTMRETLVGHGQQGIYANAYASLIYNRLNATSLQNGKPPMEYTRGIEKYVLVHNGVLYNTNELKKELQNKGHIFTENSDTEVLLRAYVEWGEFCVERLNGIFAFAIWEEHNRRLFFARDRIGVKPLFYTCVDNMFIFGSVIKTLLANPLVKTVIDIKSITEIMVLGPGRTPGCGVFKGIDEVLPGHCGFYEENKLTLRQYWRLEDKPHTDTFAQTAEKVRSLVLDSIERQLNSNMPMGTLLSGGLDSSIITAVAHNHFRKSGKVLDTFSVDYKDNDRFFKSNYFQPGNDWPYIEEMINYYGAEKGEIKHHRILLDTQELADVLYDAVDARDLPGMSDIDSSLLLFGKKIREKVAVALSGECADEIFGGYPWYRDKDIREYAGFPWSRSTEYRMSFLHPEIKIDAEKYINERYQKTINETHVLPGTPSLERRMKEMVNLNFGWFMQTLLDRKDRMTRACGLEVRVPFCDYRVAEYLYTVPWEMKDYQGREKGLLRHAMEGLLPENVLWRKKSPYPKTYNPAYLAAVSAMLREVIKDPKAPILQFIRKDAILDLLENANHVPWYGQLMTTPQTIAYFLQFNYWLQKYA